MPQRSKRGSLSRHRQNESWLREQALAASRGAIVITDPNEPDNPIVYANPAFERVTGYSVEEAVGKNCRFLQGEDRDQPALEELRAAIREGRECQVVLRNYKKDGTLFWNELSISPVHDEEGNLASFVGVLGDITERRRTEEALKRQARQVALRADVAAALSSGDTLSGVLQRCTEAMVRHLDAAFARIWTLNEEENVLELQASAGMYTHLDGPHSRVPVGELKIGLIAQERLPHLTNTVTSDPRVSDKEWAKREGMVAFAGYPLIVEDRLVGVMAMFARQALAEDTVEALASVADAIAQGIERKRAEEALREVREAERNRMARDLHDVVLQDLVYALAEIEILQLASRDPGIEVPEPALEEIAEALRRSVEGLRSAVFELRMEEGLEGSLVSSLETLVDLNRRMTRKKSEVNLTVEGDFPESLPAELGRGAIRIVQEALTNARRHSQARNVLVTLRVEDHELAAEVSDDGRGFDPAAAETGMGLKSMRERALALGGELEIESQPGKGTRVRLRAPLRTGR